MTVDYRVATPSDAVALADLGRATFTATFGHLYSAANLAAFLENHTTVRWREILTGTAHVVLAESHGTAIGYARLDAPSLPFDPGGRAAVELRQLYVLAGWHGRGIADALMERVLAAARTRAAQDLWLSVFTDNLRARRFYARYGFVEVMPYMFMVGDHADEDIICKLALDGA